MHWRRRVMAIITIAMTLGGCNARFDVAVPPSNDRLYAELYPYYAELCAVSQIRKKPGFGADTSGGPGGHAVFYLHGVCRERDSDYPSLALCDTERPGPDEGVGLSVNAHFKNANWVATDGRDFFFDGGLSHDERLTREAYGRIQAIAQAKDIYRGVVFYDGVFDDMPQGMSRSGYTYEVSIATDYAVGIGRDRYCARVPVTRAQMRKMVDYLNAVNAPYRSGAKDFEWNVLENNCAYLAHNALAAAGLWQEWPVDRFLLFAALSFPVPKNEFVNLMRRTNDMDIGDFGTLLADQSTRRMLAEDGALPTEPGALAEAVPVMPKNDIYETDPNLIFYDDPVFGSYQRHFREIFSEPRYTDLDANLRYFAALYHRIEAERKTSATQSAGFADFAAQYYAYIEREAAAVDARLAALDHRRLKVEFSK
jgi:hypothetical protein